MDKIRYYKVLVNLSYSRPYFGGRFYALSLSKGIRLAIARSGNNIFYLQNKAGNPLADLAFRRIGLGEGNGASYSVSTTGWRGRKEKMVKASWAQLQELGLRIRRGQIPEWKIPAVFGIVEDDHLGTYLHLVNDARRELISAEQVQALIEGKDEALGIFKVTVDYGLTLKQMIAAGHYDQVEGGITPEHFPVTDEGKVERELVLVHLGKVASTEEVLAELDRRGLRPATSPEHLAFGAKFPEEQKKFSIVALGSCWLLPHGDRRFAALDWTGHGRRLGVCYYNGRGWGEDCWFLAVRKDVA